MWVQVVRVAHQVHRTRAEGTQMPRSGPKTRSERSSEMKKLAFGALVAGLLAVVACGGSKSNNNTPDAVVIVTQPDAAVTTCNPIAQTGCQTTEKCTWIRVAASASSQIGQLGCVPTGDKLLNGTCTW